VLPLLLVFAFNITVIMSFQTALSLFRFQFWAVLS